MPALPPKPVLPRPSLSSSAVIRVPSPLDNSWYSVSYHGAMVPQLLLVANDVELQCGFCKFSVGSLWRSTQKIPA